MLKNHKVAAAAPAIMFIFQARRQVKARGKRPIFQLEISCKHYLLFITPWIDLAPREAEKCNPQLSISLPKIKSDFVNKKEETLILGGYLEICVSNKYLSLSYLFPRWTPQEFPMWYFSCVVDHCFDSVLHTQHTQSISPLYYQ